MSLAMGLAESVRCRVESILLESQQLLVLFYRSIGLSRSDE